MQRNQSSNSRFDGAPDGREPDEDEDRLGQARHLGEGDDVEPEVGVARRSNPLPLREEEEQELSEADIMEEHELEELGADDLAKMEGPDA